MTRSILCTLLIIIISCGNALARQTAATGNPKETAAPAAAFFISDWIAYQIGMIGQGLDAAGITGLTPVGAYFQTLPFNMYSIFTLLFVGMLMYTGRDYGPMLNCLLYTSPSPRD